MLSLSVNFDLEVRRGYIVPSLDAIAPCNDKFSSP